MAYIDIFNGDADGICALTQLHLAQPREATLITGIKRDINLLDRVEAKAGDELTVLDVSLDKNRSGLQRALDAGARVLYVDHHFAGEIPEHPALDAQINTAADVCTSLLINGRLQNRYAAWAVVGAFGDNLKQSAQRIAAPLNYSATQLEQLEQLGICMNYNGYGASVDDLHFAPDELFRLVSVHADPFVFMQENAAAFQQLTTGYHDDMQQAQQVSAHEMSSEHAALFILPAAAWARRVSGVWSNDLANQNPARAHAVLTEKADGGYLVSVRAPLQRKTGADELCRRFETGGGRAAAAGINHLTSDELERFAREFAAQFAA